MRGHGAALDDAPAVIESAEPAPSSVAASRRHLLPQGEKGARTSVEGRFPRLAVGLGFRRAATADTLAALARDALCRLPPALAGLPVVLATIAEKDRPPLREAASRLGLPVLILPKSALAGTDDRITVASEAARACLGIPSVAEAAALAAAGPGARLVVARVSAPDATCAVALWEPSAEAT